MSQCVELGCALSLGFFCGKGATSSELIEAEKGRILDTSGRQIQLRRKGFTSIIELSKKRAHSVFEGQLGVLLQGQAKVSESAGEPLELGRYDTVVGSDSDSPEILGRGFLAVVSIDPNGPTV